MGRAGSATVVLRLSTDPKGWISGLANADKALSKTGKLAVANLTAAGARMTAIGGGLQEFGGSMTRNVTLPLVALGAAAVKVSMDFEKSMNEVQAVTQATGSELEDLRKLAIKQGRDTVFSASQSAQAQIELAKAGLSVSQVMEALPATLNLAAAAKIGMADAAEIATGVLNGYRLEIKDLNHVNDVLINTANMSASEVTDVGIAMAYAGPLASLAGMKIEEAAAAIGILSNAGIQGSMAGTSLRGMLDGLLNPTDNEAVALKRLGINATDASGNLLPLADIIAQVEKNGIDAATVMEAFGQRAGPAFAAMVSQGSAKLREFAQANLNSAGAAKRMGDALMQGGAGAMEALLGSLETLAIKLGDSGLLGTVTDFINQDAIPFINWLGDLDPAALRAALRFGAVVAVLGPMASGIGNILVNGGKLLTWLASVVPLLRGYQAAATGAAAAGAAQGGAGAGAGAAAGAAAGGIGKTAAAATSALGPLALLSAAVLLVKHDYDQLAQSIDAQVSAQEAAARKIPEIHAGVQTSTSQHVVKLEESHNTILDNLKGNIEGMGREWDTFKFRVQAAWQDVTGKSREGSDAASKSMADLSSAVKTEMSAAESAASSSASAIERDITSKTKAAYTGANKWIQALKLAWQNVANTLIWHSIIPDMNEAILRSFMDNGADVDAVVRDVTQHMVDRWGWTEKQVKASAKSIRAAIETELGTMGGRYASLGTPGDSYADLGIDYDFAAEFNSRTAQQLGELLGLTGQTIEQLVEELRAQRDAVQEMDSTLAAGQEAELRIMELMLGGQSRGEALLADIFASSQAAVDSLDRMATSVFDLALPYNSNFQLTGGADALSSAGMSFGNLSSIKRSPDGTYCTDSACGYASYEDAAAAFLGGDTKGLGQPGGT